VAKRVGVTRCRWNEVVGYYSMLHRKPLGKYHVQVCTNISCLLVAASCTSMPAKKLGIGHKEVTPTGSFRSKKWNAWAPARGRRPCR
jgi:NADH-quinone oxidoreductase subunit E